MAFDVDGDEKATMGAKKQRMKWDRKKKKCVGFVHAVVNYAAPMLFVGWNTPLASRRVRASYIELFCAYIGGSFSQATFTPTHVVAHKHTYTHTRAHTHAHLPLHTHTHTTPRYIQEGSVNAVKHIRTESGNLIKVVFD